MIFRYTLIAFIASISFLLISAGLSVETTKVATYNPVPPFSGGPGTGGLGDRTGSPVSSSTCAACHGGGSFGASVSIQVLSGSTPVISYTAGNTYTVIYTVTGSSPAFGFQGTVLTSTNAAGGSFSSPSSNGQLVTIAGRPYFEHDNGASATGIFQATWTAPAANTGNVNFYGIGLAVNGNGGTSGDQVSTTAIKTLTESVPTTISYPGTPFCDNESAQSPVVTGVTTGTYSAPAGLVISPSTGLINVGNSTPGTYTINYTYSTGSTSFPVTILPTYASSFSMTICETETITFGSQTISGANPGTYTEVFQAANGCDSTVQLSLTSIFSTVSTSAEAICEGDTYDFYGQILNSSNAGSNTVTFTGANGCDSIIELLLFVNPTYTLTETATICAGETYDFYGQILTEANAGLNTVSFQTVNTLCDSTINLTLIVESIDNTVSASGAVLTANQAGATYQWIDCDNGNAAITGETNANFTATVTGNYAVEVTFNNCTETSVCTLVDFSSIDELNVSSSVVFPNPVSDVFEIKNIEQFGSIESIVLMDANGRVVMNISTLDASANIAHLDAGVYFLRIQSEAGKSIISVVKK